MFRFGGVDMIGFGGCVGVEVGNIGNGNVIGLDGTLGADEEALLESVGDKVSGFASGDMGNSLGDEVGGNEFSVIGEVIGLAIGEGFGDNVCNFGRLVGDNELAVVGNATGFSIGCRFGEIVVDFDGAVGDNGSLIGDFSGRSVGLDSGDKIGDGAGSNVKGTTVTGPVVAFVGARLVGIDSGGVNGTEVLVLLGTGR